MIATSSLHPRRFSRKFLSSAARRFRQKNNVGATGVGTLEESTALSSTTTLRFLTTESSSKQRFQEEGILDQDGLVQFDTLHEMQSRACAVFENNQLFGTFSESSESFEYMTYGEYGRKVNQCRMVLKDLGIGEFDKVGIISNNRNEWAIIAAACYSLRASLVPMYEAQLASDWSYILNDSGCSVVFCATDDIFERVQKEVFPQTPNLHASICLDADSDEPYSFTARIRITDELRTECWRSKPGQKFQESDDKGFRYYKHRYHYSDPAHRELFLRHWCKNKLKGAEKQERIKLVRKKNEDLSDEDVASFLTWRGETMWMDWLKLGDKEILAHSGKQIFVKGEKNAKERLIRKLRGDMTRREIEMRKVTAAELQAAEARRSQAVEAYMRHAPQIKKSHPQWKLWCELRNGQTFDFTVRRVTRTYTKGQEGEDEALLEAMCKKAELFAAREAMIMNTVDEGDGIFSFRVDSDSYLFVESSSKIGHIRSGRLWLGRVPSGLDQRCKHSFDLQESVWTDRTDQRLQNVLPSKYKDVPLYTTKCDSCSVEWLNYDRNRKGKRHQFIAEELEARANSPEHKPQCFVCVEEQKKPKNTQHSQEGRGIFTPLATIAGHPRYNLRCQLHHQAHGEFKRKKNKTRKERLAYAMRTTELNPGQMVCCKCIKVAAITTESKKVCEKCRGQRQEAAKRRKELMLKELFEDYSRGRDSEAANMPCFFDGCNTTKNELIDRFSKDHPDDLELCKKLFSLTCDWDHINRSEKTDACANINNAYERAYERKNCQVLHKMCHDYKTWRSKELLGAEDRFTTDYYSDRRLYYLNLKLARFKDKGCEGYIMPQPGEEGQHYSRFHCPFQDMLTELTALFRQGRGITNKVDDGNDKKYGFLAMYHFDHDLHRGVEKLFKVSNLSCVNSDESWQKTMEDEMEKCTMRCGACHRIKTWFCNDTTNPFTFREEDEDFVSDDDSYEEEEDYDDSETEDDGDKKPAAM